MKKFKLLVIAVFVAIGLNAQDSTSTGQNNKYFPVAGDIAVGTSVMPLINFIGNTFNGYAAYNTLNLEAWDLYGRYMLDNSTAVRAILSMNNGTDITREYVTDDDAVYADPLSQSQVIDQEVFQWRNMGITLGYLLFRQTKSDRFRVFYGGQLGYHYSIMTSDYSYGNVITADNINPSTFNFGTNTDFDGSLVRTINSNSGTTNSVAIGGVLGIEYFFTPYCSVMGEFGLNYQVDFESQSSFQKEKWEANDLKKYDEMGEPKQQAAELHTTNLSQGYNSNNVPAYAELILMFHF